jgi:hypothetical protein
MDRLTTIRASVLTKGDERYVLILDDESRVEALRQLGRWAANPELSLTWYDAAGWTIKMQEQRRLERDNDPD